MRKWVSLLAVLAGLAFTQSALADSPAAVYSDFAEDGVLSCGHSRSALKGALNDASLYSTSTGIRSPSYRRSLRSESSLREAAAAGSHRDPMAAPVLLRVNRTLARAARAGQAAQS